MKLVLLLASGCLAAFVAFVVLYRWVLAIAYLLGARRLQGGPDPSRLRRFLVVVPAHNEELLVEQCITSLRTGEYPNELISPHVIADNCVDRTAEIAAASGAQVHEREDPDRPGKGQALTWLFSRLDLEAYDAVAIIDADVVVDRAFFRSMNRILDRGARVAQGYDGISNPDENALTRLIAITIVMKNLLYNGGKAVLGLSPLLMGTGMVFSRDAIKERSWTAHSIGEDLEESLHWIEARERIYFVPDARIRAQEASSLSQGFSQRQRWAGGRAALRRRARQVLLAGLRDRNLALADAGFSLLSPTYSMCLNLTLAALLLWALAAAEAVAIGIVLGVALVLQIAEFGLGIILLRPPLRFVVSTMYAPVFLVWKGAIDVLARLGFGRQRWVRTSRHRNH